MTAEVIVRPQGKPVLVLTMHQTTTGERTHNHEKSQIFLPGDNIHLFVAPGRSVSVTEVQPDHPAVVAEKLDRERKAENARMIRQELQPEMVGSRPLPRTTQSDAGNDIA